MRGGSMAAPKIAIEPEWLFHDAFRTAGDGTSCAAFARGGASDRTKSSHRSWGDTAGPIRARVNACVTCWRVPCPTWDARVAGYGFVLGYHAFGLEETDDYAAAERAGREAIVPGRFRNRGLSCRGTKSSNPFPSSSESSELRARARGVAHPSRALTAISTSCRSPTARSTRSAAGRRSFLARALRYRAASLKTGGFS